MAGIAVHPLVSRRGFVKAAGAVAGAALVSDLGTAFAAPRSAEDLVAKPPSGFAPLVLPGKIVKVTKGTDFPSLMQPNQLWPKVDVARQMVERALTELTGAPSLVDAMKRFVHPSDVVALKVNGIAGQKGATMAANYEVILPLVEAILAVGVVPEKVTVFEQWPTFLMGTRVGTPKHDLPKGVVATYHANRDVAMPEIQIYNGIPTKFVRQVTEATAVINVTMIKDHSICGYTGCMKNMTHGQIINPEDHHANTANPQIAMLYRHPILQSRIRLHVTDAFKIIYDGGPLDKNPKRRIPHGAIYAATDGVAMDTYGWKVIEDARKENGLPTLAQVRREPLYIRTAADLGLGIHDLNRIRLREVAL